MVNVTIDGKQITAQDDATILEAAQENGIYIPTLCYLAKLSWLKSCRMCLVEIEDIENPLPACATPVTEGMVIHTSTPRIEKMRRDALQFLLIQHPLDCPVCDAGGQCELQNLTYQYGIDRQDYTSEEVERPDVPYGTPLIKQWMDRCVMCLRCIQACVEIPGCHVLEVVDRGLESHVEAINPEACISCGECLHVCPVGALTENVNPVKGRVWQMERVQTTCTFCGCGCQLDLNVLHGKQVIKVTSRDGVGVNDGSLCVRGRFGYDYVHHPDRLTHPLIRKRRTLQRASWESALSLVAKTLKRVVEKSGGESVGAIAPARGTNEEIYLLQKWMRLVIGSNTIDSGARLGSAPTLVGLSESLGYGAMTNGLEGVAGADVIMVVGADPDEDNLIFAHKIRRAIQKSDARVILVDPRRTALEKYANIWLRPVPGSDVAWINGLIRILIEENLADERFIEERTQGFAELKESVSSYTPEKVEKLTSIPADELHRAALLLGSARSAVIAYGSGVTQHLWGTDGVRGLANLALVTGSVGKEEGGLYPLCSQSNCQGAFDMGALPDYLPGYQRIDDRAVREGFGKAWGGKLPAKPGRSLGEFIDAIEKGRIKALVVVGENPLILLPDRKRAEAAFEKLEFLVVIDTFLNETAQKAHVVLPGATFAEKDGTVTSMERRIQRVRRAISPLGGKAEWEVISALASRMGYPMDYGHPSEIFSEMASLTPLYRGVDYGVVEAGGVQWPCSEPGHPGTPVLYGETFHNGGGRFLPVEFREPAEKPGKDFPLWLMLGSIFYNYQVGTGAKRALGLATWYPDTALEMHPDDGAPLGVSDGDHIRITSTRGKIETMARISDRVAQGTVYLAPSFRDVDLNQLLSPVRDSASGCFEYKSCAVRVERV
jgi:formate dehydrogenase alpha subunit